MKINKWIAGLFAAILLFQASPVLASTPLTYEVKKGDSLYRLAQQLNTSVTTLMRVNEVTTPSLEAGQQIRITQNTHYIVRPGDTLWKIATQNNLSVTDIQRINRLTRWTLAPGQALILPGSQNELWLEVSLDDQKVYVHREGKLRGVMVMSSGKKGSETPVGQFRIENRGEQFFNNRGRGAHYWVSFLYLGKYLFHGPVMYPNGQIIPHEYDKIGKEPASSGCIRLDLYDAKWIYDNIPQGAKVVIH